MEMMINEKIIVDDVVFIQEEISRLSGVKVLANKIKEFCEAQEHTIFYLDENLKLSEDVNCKYSWIDSGFRTARKEPIFISVVKYDDYFCGHFVGTSAYLANGVCNRRNGKNKAVIKNNIRKFEQWFLKCINDRKHKDLMEDSIRYEVIINKSIGKIENRISMRSSSFNQNGSLVDELAEEIFNNLKFPNWKSQNGLKRYLLIVGCRLQQVIAQEKKEFYQLNKVGAVVNTGLIDNFGEDYLLYYKIHLSSQREKSYKPECIIRSRRFYEENGFDVNSVNLKPISFFDDSSLFMPTIDSFDISSNSLNHIVNERNERFPDNWKRATENQKVTSIKNAILFGTKIQERDKSFAKTIYSTECKSISWLFPLHLNTDFPDDPELVLVLRKIGSFIEVKTILPYDDEIKDRITATSLYRNVW